MIVRYVGLCILAGLWAQDVQAQEVNISGEFRISPVYSRGFRMPLYEGDKPGFYTLQRTRLKVDYNKASDLKAEIIFQDRRFWGDESDRADVPTITLYRGWVEKYITPAFSIKLGRQGFVYDDEYILGDMNWVGTRAHDAGLLKYEKEETKVHLGFAYNANRGELKREHYEADFYKNLSFLWFNKDIGKLNSSFIFLNRGMEREDTAVFYTQTFGTNTNLKLHDRLKLQGMYYHQLGETLDEKRVNAFFYSVQLKYKVNEFLSLTLGTDTGSGTDQSDIENNGFKKSSTFDRLFGLAHGHFGYLDYFYVNVPTTSGIQDYYVKSKINITEKFSIDDHLHGFFTQAEINDPNNDNVHLDNFLGIENDIILNYKFSSNFKASLGHSIMFGTSTLDEFMGGNKSEENQFFYAVITATPSFFKSKTDQGL